MYRYINLYKIIKYSFLNLFYKQIFKMLLILPLYYCDKYQSIQLKNDHYCHRNYLN